MAAAAAAAAALALCLARRARPALQEVHPALVLRRRDLREAVLHQQAKGQDSLVAVVLAVASPGLQARGVPLVPVEQPLVELLVQGWVLQASLGSVALLELLVKVVQLLSNEARESSSSSPHQQSLRLSPLIGSPHLLTSSSRATV